MNLELKHIFPYFEHGLEFYSKKENTFFRLNQINNFGDFKLWAHISDDYNKDYLNKNSLSGLGFKINDVKLLLLPLENLLNNKDHKKQITPHSLHFIETGLEIKEILYNSESISLIDQALFSDVYFLLSKHYDIYGLIDNDLAINKNKI